MRKFLKKYNSIFFVGIGGASMSGLALLCKEKGKYVCGSDTKKTSYTKKLINNGIRVFNSHKKKQIKNIDLVVYSGAISVTNVEVQEAIRQQIPIMERSTFLREVSKHYKNVIAISGTHGKTTSTAMLGYIFFLAGKNPTIHIGGNYRQLGGNIYIGGNDFFITEACEFRDSFLKLRPNISIIENLEEEHLDYFKTFYREILSFNKFVNKTKDTAFINSKYQCLFAENDRIITFGDKNGFNYKNAKINDKGFYDFDLYLGNKKIDRFSMNIVGEYNIDNAISVISVCYYYKIPFEIIKAGLLTFENVDRRWQVLIDDKLILDYAHHPSEIANAIKCCKELTNKEIICFFQPHTYSRTKLLIKEFEKCFDGISKLFLLSTFSAREVDNYKGSAEFLLDRLRRSNKKFVYDKVLRKNETEVLIKKSTLQNKILLFLGAGDIDNIALNVKKLLNKKKEDN